MNSGIRAESRDFVAAMGHVACTVAIITTRNAAGERYGMTATATMSVSAEPPQLLVCVNRNATCCAAITEAGVFAVNYLGVGQSDLSRLFSDYRVAVAERFAAASWTDGLTGAPLLEDALATFDCQIAEWHDSGTHRLFVGRVGKVNHGAAMPLVYARGSYASLEFR